MTGCVEGKNKNEIPDCPVKASGQEMRAFRAIACLAVATALVGCTAAVKLRHSNGRTATCGPYLITMSQDVAAREARCLSDYQRQGFERAPE